MFINITIISLWNRIPECHEMNESRRRASLKRFLFRLTDGTAVWRHQFILVSANNGHAATCSDFPFLFHFPLGPALAKLNYLK